MKKIILFLLILSVPILAQRAVSFQSAYQDTLKPSTATYETLTPKAQFPFYTVTIWTTLGTDTVKVSTATKYNTQANATTQYYTLKAVKDLSNGAPIDMSVGIIVTTTKKEYLIYDPTLYAVKLQKNGNGATTTVFIVAGKQ